MASGYVHLSTLLFGTNNIAIPLVFSRVISIYRPRTDIYILISTHSTKLFDVWLHWVINSFIVLQNTNYCIITGLSDNVNYAVSIATVDAHMWNDNNK